MFIQTEMVNIIEDFWTFSHSNATALDTECVILAQQAIYLESSHRGAPQSRCSHNVLQHVQMCLVIFTSL